MTGDRQFEGRRLDGTQFDGTQFDRLDGNAAAGPLSELFAIDMTTARGTCEHCGTVSVVAETRLYVEVHGLALCCPGCDSVLLRMVEGEGRSRLDVSGLRMLELDDEADHPV
ncbi:DUF6510 family protein [Compostimonas suwonensis]|uniref:Uncharacterized protein n=1 Tax=Compostimonas suwonensis TaxID=1048394 RepID=A0A2M9BU12_9MICO|nr:DUF6510 family protein [Compostimonas suwonensis]PJJ61446.1 hypothetical protein CLV54_2391 [Compostimonas suwonensis]